MSYPARVLSFTALLFVLLALFFLWFFRWDLRSYAVLQQEEGTEPRTFYLARIDNPNRELA